MSIYTVVVGNIGTVYDGPSRSHADELFDAYEGYSKSGYGRASGEDVTLFMDGEPVREHFGSLNQEEVEIEIETQEDNSPPTW